VVPVDLTRATEHVRMKLAGTVTVIVLSSASMKETSPATVRYKPIATLPVPTLSAESLGVTDTQLRTMPVGFVLKFLNGLLIVSSSFLL
jgi:hypothetical protein